MAKFGKLENPKASAAAHEQRQLSEEQAKGDLQFVMATPQGRRFMYRLIYDTCGVENGIWAPSAEIHFLEGRRNVGIMVKNEAQLHAPREYVQMIQERILAAAQLTVTRAATEDDDA